MNKKTFPFGACSVQGSWPVQEDGYWVDSRSGAFSVCDGFGGRGAGDFAAQAALKVFQETVAIGPRGFQKEVIPKLRAAVEKKNEGKAGKDRGGCSMASVFVSEGAAFAFQCGACAVLLLRNGKISPVLLPNAFSTQDGTSLIPAAALGLPEPVFESRSFSVEAGDFLVLLSSGVPWESEIFQAELLGQLALRLPLSEMGSIASALLENGQPSLRNQTLLLVEAI